MIQQFDTLLSAHDDKCGHHVSPDNVTIILLAIFPMLSFSPLL